MYLLYSLFSGYQAIATPHPATVAFIKVNKDPQALNPILSPHLPSPISSISHGWQFLFPEHSFFTQLPGYHTCLNFFQQHSGSFLSSFSFLTCLYLSWPLSLPLAWSSGLGLLSVSPTFLIRSASWIKYYLVLATAKLPSLIQNISMISEFHM